MRTLPLYQVDAFASEPFRGNPAAVCPLEAWLPDPVLQSIAEENNLAETAFFVADEDGGYELRWFTPRHEVPLCGHATLASAFVIFEAMEGEAAEVRFRSRSGELRVAREGDLYTLDFPAERPGPLDEPPAPLVEVPGLRPEAVLSTHEDPNHFLVLSHAEEVASFEAPLQAWEGLHPYGVVVTAAAVDSDLDFVSRYFAPSYGIPEDPVTGSIHCALAPYWAERLGRADLRARQLSARGGDIRCRVREDRVLLSGPAVLYLRGEIRVP